MLSSAKGCQLLRLVMGQDRWQLSSQKAKTKSSPNAHDHVQDKNLLLLPPCPPSFLLNVWYSFLATFWEFVKTWEVHAKETPPTWGSCFSGVREGEWRLPEKKECVLGLSKQSCDNKAFFLVIAVTSLKSEHKKFDPMFATVQMWPNLSLELLPLKTMSSRFSFLWSLSSWREWSNLSCILKLWLMRCVCDCFKVRWDFNNKHTTNHCRKGLAGGTERWSCIAITYHDSTYLFP